MSMVAEHQVWCTYVNHSDCCGKECDCGAVDTNNYIADLYSLLWKVAAAPRVYTVDEEHIAVFIEVGIAKEIENIIGYDEMGQ